MKTPKKPPSTQDLLQGLRGDSGRMEKVIEASLRAQDDGKYLHWDKLRHMTPSSGLRLEDRWLALKIARARGLRDLPLLDKHGQPFRFGLPDPVSELLHYITQNASGRIGVDDRAITNPDTRDRYVVRSLMEEAITSSQLEGAATTRRVAKEMLRSNRKPIDTNEQMILNNYIAMQHIRDLRREPLSEALILELHRILTFKTMKDPDAAGRFRRSDEEIRVYDDRDNQLLHTPPPAEELPARLAAMCDFANEKTPGYFVDPTVRATILHFWLAYDHPFVDGNGRCARALFYWSMLKMDYWLCEFISISEIIRKAPAKYARSFLYTETDEDDLTYFLVYHLEIIRRAIAQLHEYVEKKTGEIRRLERVIRASARLNHRQLALLSHALRHPDAEYTVRSHRASHNVVHQTARADLYDLVYEKGLLTAGKSGRSYYFRPVPDLQERLQQLH